MSTLSIHKEHPYSAFERKHFVLASKLIDSIFAEKAQRKTVVMVERNRFFYVPSDGSKKMVIRLKRVSL
jgi:hypothetical protein